MSLFKVPFGSKLHIKIRTKCDVTMLLHWPVITAFELWNSWALWPLDGCSGKTSDLAKTTWLFEQETLFTLLSNGWGKETDLKEVK